jgi:hypothetical protein
MGGSRWRVRGGAPELARQLGIMAGARGAPVLDGRQPVAGEGWGPGLARQLGIMAGGPRRPDARWAAAGGG